MIKIENDEITLNASSLTELLTEISALISAVSKQVVESSGGTDADIEIIERDIFDSLRFTRLVNGGMSGEEAFNTINPELNRSDDTDTTDSAGTPDKEESKEA